MSSGDHSHSRHETGFLPAIPPRVARRQFQISVALVVVMAIGVYGLIASVNVPHKPVLLRARMTLPMGAMGAMSPVKASGMAANAPRQPSTDQQAAESIETKIPQAILASSRTD